MVELLAGHLTTGHSSNEIAKAIFRGGLVLGSGKCKGQPMGRPSVERDERKEQHINEIKQAVNAVVRTLAKYNIEASCSGQTWIALNKIKVTQFDYGSSKEVRFVCAKCKNRGVLSLIAVGKCSSPGEGSSPGEAHRVASIEILHLFPHNKDCAAAISSSPGEGSSPGEAHRVASIEILHLFPHNKDCAAAIKPPLFELVKERQVEFDFHEVIGDTYRGPLLEINKLKVGDKLVGQHINFGTGDYKYDDRMVQPLPWSLSEGDEKRHKWCMIRLLFHFSIFFNIVDETASQTFDDEAVANASALRRTTNWCGYPSKHNPEAHLFIDDPSLIYGGHNMLDGDAAPVHQVCHTDHAEEPNNLLADDPALAGKTMPGTIIVPLEDWRSIYFGNPDNTKHVPLGGYMYFPGNADHGGMTVPPSEGWHPALHLHLDSSRHPRLLKDHLNLSQYDFTPTEHIVLVSDVDALEGIIGGTTVRMHEAIGACGKLEGTEYYTMFHHLLETNMSQYQMLLKELKTKANAEKQESRGLLKKGMDSLKTLTDEWEDELKTAELEWSVSEKKRSRGGS
jgi:hypothetical protein